MEETNEYLRAVKRLWPVIVIATLLGVAAAFFATPAQVTPLLRSYRATHTMLLNGSNNGQVGTITFQQVPLFATTGEVPKRVAEKLKWSGAPAALSAQIQAAVDGNTQTFTITTTQVDPARAELVANTFAEELVKYLAERQDQVNGGRLAATLKRVDELKKQASDLDNQVQLNPTDEVLKAQRDAAVRQYGAEYEQYQNITAETNAGVGLTTLQRAQAVAVESGGFKAPRSRKARVPLAGGVGALMGLGLALIMDRFDGRVRDRKRAEQVMGAPVVAELATLDRKDRGTKLCVVPDHQGGVAEGYRTLRAALAFMASSDPAAGPDGSVAPVILVSSPSPGDGKTTTAANVAAAFAETGSRVLVVNADFRRPKISSFFVSSVDFGRGLDVAAVAAMDPEDLLIATDNPNVSLIDLSSIYAAPGDLARVSARAVAGLRHQMDVVIIDTPPLGVTAEALEFVAVASLVLLIARVGRTKVRSADRACELVRFIGATSVAVALTDTGRLNRGRAAYDGVYHGTVTKNMAQVAPKQSKPPKPGRGKPKLTPLNGVTITHARHSKPAGSGLNGSNGAKHSGNSSGASRYTSVPVGADDDDDLDMDDWDDD